jgi:hypothetical protein
MAKLKPNHLYLQQFVAITIQGAIPTISGDEAYLILAGWAAAVQVASEANSNSGFKQ